MKTTQGTVFLMTDKAKTKDVPCTHPGCPNICRVNTFYAPAKAKCPHHGGHAMTVTGRIGSEDGFQVEHFEPQTVATVEVPMPENRNLGQLMCPICPNEPLEILAVSESGNIDFGCQKCQTVVSVAFGWRVMQMRSVPKRLMPLVKEFNIRQVGTMDVSLAAKLASLKFGSGLTG